ncbi:hypothetical protein Bca4012_038235 [Brassica carinata]
MVRSRQRWSKVAEGGPRYPRWSKVVRGVRGGRWWSEVVRDGPRSSEVVRGCRRWSEVQWLRRCQQNEIVVEVIEADEIIDGIVKVVEVIDEVRSLTSSSMEIPSSPNVVPSSTVVVSLSPSLESCFEIPSLSSSKVVPSSCAFLPTLSTVAPSLLPLLEISRGEAPSSSVAAPSSSMETELGRSALELSATLDKARGSAELRSSMSSAILVASHPELSDGGYEFIFPGTHNFLLVTETIVGLSSSTVGHARESVELNSSRNGVGDELGARPSLESGNELRIRASCDGQRADPNDVLIGCKFVNNGDRFVGGGHEFFEHNSVFVSKIYTGDPSRTSAKYVVEGAPVEESSSESNIGSSDTGSSVGDSSSESYDEESKDDGIELGVEQDVVNVDGDERDGNVNNEQGGAVCDGEGEVNIYDGENDVGVCKENDVVTGNGRDDLAGDGERDVTAGNEHRGLAGKNEMDGAANSDNDVVSGDDQDESDVGFGWARRFNHLELDHVKMRCKARLSVSAQL